MKNKIEALAEGYAKEMLADIRELVAVRSVKGEPSPGLPYGSAIGEAIVCAESIARRHGFSASCCDGYMLEVNLNDLPDALGILCHLDVVHEGSGWTTPPYEADVREGKIYGRGTADNKGPAIASLYALKLVRELGVPLRRNVRLMLGTDEESGSSDLKEYFKRRTQPPFCFSPDAAFPVYNLEKGRFAPQFSAAYAVSDALPRILTVEGGHAVNIVPEEARAVVQGLSKTAVEEFAAACSEKTGVSFTVEGSGADVTIAARGLSTHASYPEDGNNALTALIELLAAMPFAPCEGFAKLLFLHSLLPHGDYHGKALGIAQEDELSGPLTCNLGIFRYGLDALEGGLDARCPICSNEENTSKVIEKALGAQGIGLSATKMVLPHHVPEQLPFIQTLLRSFESYSGLTGECLSMGGGTYVHGMPNSVAFGAAFPDTETYAHAADEYAVIEELVCCVKIFADIIIEMCS